MNRSPLLAHASLDDVFAYRVGGPVRVRDFLADAEALRARLPSGRHLLNVCQDRYHFAVGFAAGLLDRRTSLQPASQSPETLRRLQDDYADLICLADWDFDSLDLPRVDFPDGLAADPDAVAAIPLIDSDHVAACLFTSGSTGMPQPYAKTWGKLVRNGRAEAERLGLLARPHAIVGTVPVQHSYGFESTFLLGLHGRCPFWAGKPFYPQDIATALAAVPRPRLLVTTPFHLSAFIAAGIETAPIDLVLSATAPLAASLAAEAERRFGAPVLEIYGCTETGQIASRQLTADPAWQPLPDVVLAQQDDLTFAEGGHVERRFALSDVIELRPDGRFLLLGRNADLINIAGKRTSLAYLNHQIAAIDGVRDAAFFLPDAASREGISRLAAFVVAPDLDRRTLLQALRARIDPVFLPRPLILLDALPRNAVGKLPRADLEALYAGLSEKAGG